MTPKVEKIYNKIYYSKLTEYEIKQLMVGLVGMTLTAKSFEDAAKTTCDYKYDDVAK
tara:strand:+ start:924 stop:1094 length:171 start_codon:yes stop_codon:yes gene_type:complete